MPNNCTLKYNFGALLQPRQSRWSHLKNPYTRPWQIDVNDNFLGYAYARAYGVRTPRLFDCASAFPSINVKEQLCLVTEEQERLV